jgi:hypothetical protein
MSSTSFNELDVTIYQAVVSSLYSLGKIFQNDIGCLGYIVYLNVFCILSSFQDHGRHLNVGFAREKFNKKMLPG